MGLIPALCVRAQIGTEIRRRSLVTLRAGTKPDTTHRIVTDSRHTTATDRASRRRSLDCGRGSLLIVHWNVHRSLDCGRGSLLVGVLLDGVRLDGHLNRWNLSRAAKTTRLGTIQGPTLRKPFDDLVMRRWGWVLSGAAKTTHLLGSFVGRFMFDTQTDTNCKTNVSVIRHDSGSESYWVSEQYMSWYS